MAAERITAVAYTLHRELGIESSLDKYSDHEQDTFLLYSHFISKVIVAQTRRIIP